MRERERLNAEVKRMTAEWSDIQKVLATEKAAAASAAHALDALTKVRPAAHSIVPDLLAHRDATCQHTADVVLAACIVRPNGKIASYLSSARLGLDLDLDLDDWSSLFDGCACSTRIVPLFVGSARLGST